MIILEEEGQKGEDRASRCRGVELNVFTHVAGRFVEFKFIFCVSFLYEIKSMFRVDRTQGIF